MQDKRTMDQASVYERMSALLDGQAHKREMEALLAELHADPSALERWQDYHLIGDVLRAGPSAAVGLHDGAFLERLRHRLDEEGRGSLRVATAGRPADRNAANDSVWRWRLIAGISSLALLGSLGWQMLQAGKGAANSPQLVRADGWQSRVASADGKKGEQGAMLRDPRLDQLIAAHQQMGGSSALQIPAGFLRNATFERPAQ